MAELNALDLEVLRRALALPEMARFAPQVLAVSEKLGLPAPEWARPLPPPGPPPADGGS